MNHGVNDVGPNIGTKTPTSPYPLVSNVTRKNNQVICTYLIAILGHGQHIHTYKKLEIKTFGLGSRISPWEGKALPLVG